MNTRGATLKEINFMERPQDPPAREEFIVKSNQNQIILHYFRKCKQHFIAMIMKDMRREIRNLYRGADRAYAALDFTGVGEITEKDFLESMICKRLSDSYSQEDFQDFFFQTNAFQGGMNFDSFKKTFFPHLYLIEDSLENDDSQ